MLVWGQGSEVNGRGQRSRGVRDHGRVRGHSVVGGVRGHGVVGGVRGHGVVGGVRGHIWWEVRGHRKGQRS